MGLDQAGGEPPVSVYSLDGEDEVLWEKRTLLSAPFTMSMTSVCYVASF
jgi:hypothetical protein